jgi:hypothetical protein
MLLFTLGGHQLVFAKSKLHTVRLACVAVGYISEPELEKSEYTGWSTVMSYTTIVRWSSIGGR